MGQLDGIKDYRFGQNIKRTPEEERKLKQKGAAASHIARKRNKTMQQCAKLLLSAEPDDNAKALLKKNGIEEDDMTNQMVIMFNLMQLVFRYSSKFLLCISKNTLLSNYIIPPVSSNFTENHS